MARVVVITVPAPIMTAAQAQAGMPALAGVDEGVLVDLVAAASEEIGGPTGWLGRSLGEQTLELRLPAFPCGGIALPLVPIVEMVSITYTDAGGDVVMPEADYELRTDRVVPKSGWPSGCNVRIQYKAGYNPVPAIIRTAVKLRVGELAMQFGRDATLKKEVVEGVGSFEYDVGADAKRSVTSRAVEALLGGLRVLTI
jgi:hypothetical protein